MLTNMETQERMTVSGFKHTELNSTEVGCEMQSIRVYMHTCLVKQKSEFAIF